jgi:hypothetical protein
MALFLILLFAYFYFFRSPTFNMTESIVFVGILVGMQLFANMFELYTRCKSTQDSLNVLFITIVPWLFIFVVTLVFVKVLPPSISEGLKSPFSNVIGYLWLQKQANQLMNDILVDPAVSKTLNRSTLNSDEKENLETASQAILKIVGDNSVIFNEITPSNFEKYWTILAPLMKQPMNEAKKKELYDLAVYRDSIGEFFWLLYTGILSISLVDYQLTTFKCSSTLQEINTKLSEYHKDKKIQEDEKTKTASQTYTM